MTFEHNYWQELGKQQLFHTIVNKNQECNDFPPYQRR